MRLLAVLALLLAGCNGVAHPLGRRCKWNPPKPHVPPGAKLYLWTHPDQGARYYVAP